MISSHHTTRPHNSLRCGLLCGLLWLALSSLCVRAERAHLPPTASQRTHSHTFPHEEPVGYRRLSQSESLSLLRSLAEDESLPFANSALTLHALYDVYTVQQDDKDTHTDTDTHTQRSLRSHKAHTQRPVQMRFRPLPTDSLTHTHTHTHAHTEIHTDTHTEKHTRTLSQHSLTSPHTLPHTLTDRRTDRSTDGVTQLVPLYPGYGTHFVYVFVGTPPQRQSVIVDTGSHLTAFPCTGCAQCGTHTDPYFSVENSSSAVIPRCLNNQRCLVSQSYTEGSSWKGYKVQDRLHMGGNTAGLLPLAERLSVPFVFACQTSETGLFRTQLADGIMGLSHSPDTLPHTLRAHNLTQTLAFALCYRIGGGVLTLGGVDPRLHHFRGGAGGSVERSVERGIGGPIGIRFARTYTQQNGWFGVRLLGLHLLDSTSSNSTEEVLYPVETDPRTLNGGVQGGAKGVIVDSGTTDTYLPKSLATQFMNAFGRATQRSVLYSTSAVSLTPAQLQKLPVIVFTLEGAKRDENDNGSGADENNVVRVYMPYTSYLDAVGNGRYAFRVYLTESVGAVLGANFMLNHNILFDAERERIGFAPSPCDFQEFVPPPQPTQPTKAPTKTPQSGTGNTLKPSNGVIEEDPVISALCDAHTPTHTPTGALALTQTHIAFTECSAKCTRNDSLSSYTVFGAQQFVPSPCLSTQSHNTTATFLGGDRLHTSASIVTHSCHENCTRTHAVRGPTRCPDTPWSECTHGCVTSRRVVPLTEPLLTSRGECNYRTQTQTCYTGHCPVESEDYMVYVDLRVRVRAREWSYVHTESFVEALKRVYKLKYNGIEILNNVLTASSSSSASTKLHIQIRLKAKDYTTSRTLHAAAERIVSLTQDTLPQTNPQARFSALFAAHLRSVAVTQDRGESDRFGWMIPADITVLSAVALPVSVSDQRDPHNRGSPHTGTDTETQTTRTRTVEVNLMILLGVGVGVCVSLSVVLFLYVRLRQQLALLSKDKPLSSSHNKTRSSTHTLSAEVLLRVWNKFAKTGAGSQAHTQSSNTQRDVELASLTREQLEEELRLAQSGLIAAESEEEN